MKRKERPWGEDETTLALKLWKDGLTATEIAKQLGTERSRNSVIGLVHRKGAQRRMPVVARKARIVSAPRPPRASRARDAQPARNMHITKIKRVPPPEKQPNKFDDTPASRAAMALLGQCYSADQRRQMFWGSR
jgi:hypothetical protein